MLTLQSESLNWTLNYIMNHGDTKSLPLPYEYSAIKGMWNDYFEENFLKVNLMEKHAREFKKYLVPDVNGGWVGEYQLDPLDSMVYNSIIYELKDEIENYRESIGSDVCYSNKLSYINSELSIKQDLFGLVKRVKEDTGNYLIRIDIDDMSSYVNIDIVHQILLRISRKSYHVSKLIYLLRSMAFRDTQGIPDGPIMSKLLLELVLRDIDQIFLDKGYSYFRYSNSLFFSFDSYPHISENEEVIKIIGSELGVIVTSNKVEIIEKEVCRLSLFDSGKYVDYYNLLKDFGLEKYYSDYLYEDKEDFRFEGLNEFFIESVSKRENLPFINHTLTTWKGYLEERSYLCIKDNFEWLIRNAVSMYRCISNDCDNDELLRTLKAFYNKCNNLSSFHLSWKKDILNDENEVLIEMIDRNQSKWNKRQWIKSLKESSVDLIENWKEENIDLLDDLDICIINWFVKEGRCK